MHLQRRPGFTPQTKPVARWGEWARVNRAFPPFFFETLWKGMTMTTRLEVKRNYFNKEDLRTFLVASRNPRELLWWLLMADSGLRMGELRSLFWADLAGDSVRVLGKGRKWRTVPLTSRLREQIKRVKWLEGPLPEAKVCPISARAVQARFQRVLKRSGLPTRNRCPHSLRHTFATSCLVAGVDIHRVGVLLGHSNTMVTTGYLHTDQRALAEAAARLDKYNEEDGDNGEETAKG